MNLNLPRLILRWINDNRGDLSIQSFIIKTLTETKDFKDYEESQNERENTGNKCLQKW